VAALQQAWTAHRNAGVAGRERSAAGVVPVPAPLLVDGE